MRLHILADGSGREVDEASALVARAGVGTLLFVADQLFARRRDHVAALAARLPRFTTAVVTVFLQQDDRMSRAYLAASVQQ